MIFHPIKYYQNQDHYYWLCHQIITCLIFDISFFSFSVSSHFYITNMGSFIKRQTSGTTSDNEWYNEWQRMTTSGTTSENEWQRVTTSGTRNDNEWQRMTTSENKWRRVTISAKFPFFKIREGPTTKHPKENSLNIEEDLWRRPIELRVEINP